MAHRRTLTLTQSQRHELLEAIDHDPKPYVRERSAAMLQIADGRSAYRVAQEGLLKPRDPDTVYGWLDAYQVSGLDGLRDRQHGGDRRSCF
ncbi:MAG: hypothetical protein ACFCD0_14640 [Gemmataceae bacterium]